MARLSAEMERLAEDSLARTKEASARETSQILDRISGAIRRIRNAGEVSAVLAELVETSALFSRRAALLLHSEGTLIGFHSAGQGCTARDLEGLSVGLASAPAIAHAIETRDTVVSTATQRNVSHGLWKRLSYAGDEDLRVQPLILRETVLAVLIVEGGTLRAAVVEVLVLTAEAWIEALGSREDRDRQ